MPVSDVRYNVYVVNQADAFVASVCGIKRAANLFNFGSLKADGEKSFEITVELNETLME